MMARVDVSRQRRVENASRSAVGSTAAAIPRKKAPTKPSPPPLSVSATKRNSALVIAPYRRRQRRVAWPKRGTAPAATRAPAWGMGRPTDGLGDAPP